MEPAEKEFLIYISSSWIIQTVGQGHSQVAVKSKYKLLTGGMVWHLWRNWNNYRETQAGSLSMFHRVKRPATVHAPFKASQIKAHIWCQWNGLALFFVKWHFITGIFKTWCLPFSLRHNEFNCSIPGVLFYKEVWVTAPGCPTAEKPQHLSGRNMFKLSLGRRSGGTHVCHTLCLCCSK